MSMVCQLSFAKKRVVGGIAGLLLLLIALTNCGGSDTTTAPTPTPTPLQFTTLNLGLPAKAYNAPVVGPLPDTTLMNVRIAFKVNQNAVKQGNRNKVQSGKGQDLKDLANQIGITDATYQQIKSTLAALGVQDAALTLSKLHTDLKVDAKAKTVAALFQTHFVVHRLNDRTYYVPATPPKLPTFIANYVVSVTGLESYSTPPGTGLATRAKQKHAIASKRHATADCNAPNNQLFPSVVAHAYGYDQLWNRGWHGENMTVNLVEIDGFDPNDVQNYFDCVHYRGNFRSVNVDGAPTKIEGESTLDIDMLAGLARSINIVDYQSDGGSWLHIEDELQQIIDDNTNNANSAGVVSVSLGAAEMGVAPSLLDAIDQRIQQLTKVEHMTVFVASGDCAAFSDQIFNSLSVSFPASDPLAVSVGGTQLRVGPGGNRNNEIVWSDGSDQTKCRNRWGSGGGNSTFYQQPSFQTGNGVNNQYSRGFRQVPDLSAVAFDLAVYLQGQWQPVGGTSAATPIWAAGFALVNEGLIQQTGGYYFYGPDTFYSVANSPNGLQPYFDVTEGNNLYYPATPGWDFASGLGTPGLLDFYKVLLAAANQH